MRREGPRNPPGAGGCRRKRTTAVWCGPQDQRIAGGLAFVSHGEGRRLAFGEGAALWRSAPAFPTEKRRRREKKDGHAGKEAGVLGLLLHEGLRCGEPFSHKLIV